LEPRANTGSNIFSVDWAGPAQSSSDEPQDNAACMALNLYAMQSGPYPSSGIPAGQYVAENATSHHLRLEAIYPGFTGRGYPAGWNANGQSVDFNINLPSAGTHLLTLRYAEGAGNASRLIAINGTNAFPNYNFPGTGAWTNYNTVTVP
jgi:hypothetical protein